MQGSSKLYVGNLKYSVTKAELEQRFSEFGAIKDIIVIDGKGFGFVEYETSEDAEKAKEALNNTEFQGRTLRIDVAHPPKAKPARGGFGGDRRSSGGYGRMD